MPFFILNRNYALSTTKGHSVNFKKGEKTWVPQGIVTEALAIGAIPEKPIDVLSPEEAALREMTTEDRQKKVFEAFEKLLLRGARGDFAANGQPAHKKVEEIAGFDLEIKEREALWHAYNQMKQEEAQKA